ncbi:SapC family protein [Cellvibrio zantedeschiae]|uniref:SapC family protein n=1 Tax=Cellvibrio zantedeschiae TaxID=1237077 RepID=A0ABQ3B2V8_9GAMM|nr:SapC family protein [Cellvibrio zantedeschiae]GGY71640.1 SapC family protein [Cellvibrio zantedeschiae]
MTNHVLLDNITHKDLKIITKKSAEFGDNQRGVITFPTEFRAIQNEYPIFFQRNPDTDEFQAVAMLGFEEGENLFLDEKGWNANYIPAAINRDPFLIGYKNDTQDGAPIKRVAVHVDMDSPRISKNDQGAAVFLPYGGNSEYLERIQRMLLVIQDGVPTSKAMFDAFKKWDLLEPFTLNIEFIDGKKYSLINNFTVNEEKLYQLDGAALQELNSTGFLFSAYMVIASMANIQTLIEKRNSLLAKTSA